MNRARHTSFTGGAYVAVGFVSNVHSAAAAPELRRLAARRAGKVLSRLRQYQSPLWQEATAGLNHAAAEMHVKAEFVGPDTYDSKAEHEQFQDALRQMPTGILISASAPNLLNSDIDAATLGPAEEQQPNKR